MSELSSSVPTHPHPTPLGRIDALSSVRSPLSGIEIVSKLDAAARRGRLPGFHKGEGAALFRITDFGHPFEFILEANATPSGPCTELRFTLRMKPLLPRIFIASMILSVWPGVWLTDSMMQTYFGWYNPNHLWWVTYAWYLPLTVPFVPLGIAQALKKSRINAQIGAIDLIGKIQALVGDPPTGAGI
jgi:hypothetical protein